MPDRSAADKALPVKILVIGHDAGLGGAQLSLLEILKRLSPGKYQALVVVPTPGPFVDALRKLRIECHCGFAQRWIFFHKPMPERALLASPWRLLSHPHLWAVLSLITLPLRVTLLAALAKMNGIGLIYSNTATILDGAVTARMLGIPHVWHLREVVTENPDLNFPGPVSWLPQFILRWSDRVIVNSNALRISLFGGDTSNKVSVIPNGIALDVPDEEYALADLPIIPRRAPISAICGRLVPGKGIHTYIEALALLKHTLPAAHHMIIGEGHSDYKSRLQAMVRDSGLDDRVHFLGYRNDFCALLGRIDLLVSASTRESFGRTVIEAMAHGVPVVATRSGGPEEIIVDGDSGLLVDIGDATAIAEHMTRLLGNAEAARLIGTNGRKRVLECFDIKMTVGKIKQVFDDVLSTSR